MNKDKENELNKLKEEYKRKNGAEVRSRKCKQCGKEFFIIESETELKTSDPSDDYEICKEHILLDIMEMYPMNFN